MSDIEFPRSMTPYAWESFLANASMEALDQLDAAMIGGMATLIYNLGPSVEAIGIEGVRCKHAYTLESGESVPQVVFDMLALLHGHIPVFFKLPDDAPEEARWFIYGLESVEDGSATSSLLRPYADALARKQLGAASSEDSDLLNERWRGAQEALRILFEAYVMYPGFSDDGAPGAIERTEQLQFPVANYFLVLLDDFDPLEGIDDDEPEGS